MENSLRLLVVDDDEEHLELVRRLLSAYKFEVRTTSSPIGVSNLVREFLPNVILIDVNQPALSGDRILTLVRRNAKSMAKLVLFSSADPERLRQLAKSVEADGWIPKGLAPRELADQLRRVCAT
ncbi:MAG: response regulator [Sandaracinaceae bacterium]|nr:MAG: response regulator [Sandaracinaceae bacterium]